MNQSQLLKNLILKYKYSILICLIFLFAVFYTMFTGANTRAFDITIFNPTDKWQAMSERRYEAIVQGVPSSIARLFSNKITFIFKTFVTNYVGYLSPEFLFTKGVSESSYGMVPGRGVLYLFEIIPIAAFLYSVIRKESFKGANFLLVWILLSPTLAALTKGLGYSGTRAAIMMPAIQILSAYGLVYLFDCLRGSLAGFRKLFIYSLAVVLLISVVSFLEDYYFHAPARSAKSMSYGMKQTINYINDVESKYDRILISRSLSVPHIWISFFNKIDPKVVQKAAKNWIRYEKEGLVSVDQLDEYQLGKYIFGDIYYDERKDQKNTLFIGRPEDFSVSARPSKIIYYPNGEPAYLVAESIN